MSVSNFDPKDRGKVSSPPTSNYVITHATTLLRHHSFSHLMPRMKVCGLLSCCFGLCSGIFTVVIGAFFANNIVNFLLLLSLVVAATAFIFGGIFCNYLHDYPKDYTSVEVCLEKGEGRKVDTNLLLQQLKRMYYGFFIIGAIVIWICITSFTSSFTNVSTVPFCIVLLGMLRLLQGG